ncbi:Flagellar basal body-associated protein FliL [Moorella glycerini]|uniref:Flagellar protein FliL n=1 Tax=Neomoorella stamsii TaxID=1266720 RepID=A0A9X7P603_9FIRM|nr:MULTISPECIES: flagellar basal body-associated FliL family protein [Moorella]PRR72281.1 flagellar basal body-associated protein FliL [Moorella stamsii]CEP68908.1 Flagellar basal body-associated protein FliL [Moorella glycerini]CEP69582.1 Flagellar basal body-associated protein FliL [Moorella glycerini]
MPPRDEAEKKEKKNRPRLIVALLLVILLLIGGYVYYFFFGGSSRSLTAAATAGNQVPLNMQKMSLEPIVVNLADPGLRRYLRLKITLEYSDARLTTELNDKLYRIRDTIISVLRSKKTDDLQNEDALKRELLTAINSQLIAGQVRGLYFEEFIIQ